jgi:signal transduction histidine kinase
MSARAPDRTASVPVEAMELFVDVLSQSEPGTSPGEDFYDRLCDAVCRLGRMRRAIIFRYDSASRRVRAAGAHGIDREPFAGAHISVESLPITAQALQADQVLEVSGDLREHVVPEFAALLQEPVRLACAPMAAAGRWIGVILADRPLDAPPLDDAERHLLWTLGKAAALASMARIVVYQAETAKQLQHRIDLARDVHESVIQRLFGVSMALDGDGDLPAEARARCASETQEALADLRSALQRPLGRAPRETQTTLAEELHRLARAEPALGIRLVDGRAEDVPAALEPLAQSVLTEAIRNARKHARPSFVHVRVGRLDGAFVLEVVNDGVTGRPRRAGMGLRLSAFEALQHGGVVEFGERDAEPGRIWQVRLVVPVDG